MNFMSNLSGSLCLLTPVTEVIGLKCFSKYSKVGIFFIFLGNDELLIKYRT